MLRWPLLGSLALFGALGFLASPSLAQEKDKKDIKFDLTFVRTVEPVMNKMFELCKITKDDMVFDLGCGDGFILCEACKRFGCKGVGVDLDPQRVKQANDMVKKFGLEGRVEIREGNALEVKDIDRATVVILYMFPQFMTLWEPIAKEKLKAGARIGAHDYRWEQKWDPDVTAEVKGPYRTHTVYMWQVKAPNKK